MNRISILTYICAITLFPSCEKVIDANLNSSTPQYVIEGNITNLPGPYFVKITKSKNFDEDNTFPTVRNAKVIITDNSDSQRDTLLETMPGVYQTQHLRGKEGNTYTLNITISDRIFFSAKSTMPEVVEFESIELTEINFFGKAQKIPVPIYFDPQRSINFYRLIEFVNGEKDPTIFVRDDKQSNGIEISQPLISNEIEIKANDTVVIEMQSIDQSIYDYFYSLSQISGGGTTASPANPITNIEGGALGYFSAHTVQVKTMVIK